MSGGLPVAITDRRLDTVEQDAATRHEERRRASVTVAAHARDAGDLVLLLEALGLDRDEDDDT